MMVGLENGAEMGSTTKDILLKKILSREARVGIIGLGYVGLLLILRFGDEGFRVIGFDVDPEKVTKLNKGQSYIRHIATNRIEHHVREKRFEATTDFSRLTEADCIIIC